jgi:hypothetical protein
MLTPSNIANDARKSGYDHVIEDHGGPGRIASKPYRAEHGYRGGRAAGTARGWRGPRRALATEAAQDYCDYVNGNNITVKKLVNAGHATVKPDVKKVTHPKRAEAYRLLAEAAADEGNDPSGYVYCISDGTAMKLGKSADHPQNRLKGLQTGNPRMLSLMGFKQVPDRTAAEAALHAKYHDTNILGEWFDFDKRILKEFV